MAKQRSRQQEALRRLVAVEAARLISGHGIRDFHQAKLKAADRLALDQRSALPSNAEIETALREQQALFAGNNHQANLQMLRQAALIAMQRLATFSPRLVGGVLDGTADHYSAICLHAFVDSPEDLVIFLQDRQITFDARERVLRLDRERTATFPVFEFDVDNAPFDVTAMPPKYLRQAPLSPTSGRSIQRANAAALQLLIETEQPSDPMRDWSVLQLNTAG